MAPPYFGGNKDKLDKNHQPCEVQYCCNTLVFFWRHMQCIGVFDHKQKLFSSSSSIFKAFNKQCTNQISVCYCALKWQWVRATEERELIGSSDPQIGANQLEFNYQEIEHTLMSVETVEGPRVLAIQGKFGLLETWLTMNLSVRKRRNDTSRTIDSDDCIGGSGDGDGIYQESWWVSGWWRCGTSALFQHLQRGTKLPPETSKEWNK